ncbi:MAG TPA: hypothetical protein VM470_03055 [Acidimicrobiia bacterium]|nr:hypothetical protein [Acidimicrobiia bacterium]
MQLLADRWWLLLIPLLALGVHVLATRLEDKGLIYYRRPPAKGVATAMMNYQRIFEPSVEHVIEYQQSGDLTIQTSSEPGPPQPTTGA